MPRGVYKRTPEHCAALAKAARGIPKSPEHCAAISAGQKGIPRTPETCAAISKAQKGVPKSPEHCAAISKAQQGVPKSPFTSEHRASLSRALTGRILSHETRIAMSASRQDISVEDWIGFVSFGEYCPKFNEKLKRQIRDQYNNCDYMSGLPVTICNNGRNLDVHHIDYNKQQGCDDHEWRLIPLSRSNHVKTNVNRSFWNRLFTYSLQYDETYYEDLDEVIALDEFEIGVITI